MPNTTTGAPSRSVVVIDGNPQPASRTATVGRLLGERLADLAELDASEVEVIGLSSLGPGLLEWGDESVEHAKRRVLGATLVVVATPTYKATFTGLLKLFLDRFAAGELVDVRAVVPLMTGAAPGHSLAVDVHLRPVLIEIGARIPTTGLYVWGDQIDQPDEVLDAWLDTEAEVIRRQLR